MKVYRIVITRSAEKDFSSIPFTFVQRISKQIDALALEPRPRGSKKLKGESNLWRVRIGDYRVVYYIFEDTVMIKIVSISHRKDVYRNL
jgi:mRNA interferase RelE/StbE